MSLIERVARLTELKKGETLDSYGNVYSVESWYTTLSRTTSRESHITTCEYLEKLVTEVEENTDKPELMALVTKIIKSLGYYSETCQSKDYAEYVSHQVLLWQSRLKKLKVEFDVKGIPSTISEKILEERERNVYQQMEELRELVMSLECRSEALNKRENVYKIQQIEFEKSLEALRQTANTQNSEYQDKLSDIKKREGQIKDDITHAKELIELLEIRRSELKVIEESIELKRAMTDKILEESKNAKEGLTRQEEKLEECKTHLEYTRVSLDKSDKDLKRFSDVLKQEKEKHKKEYDEVINSIEQRESKLNSLQKSLIEKSKQLDIRERDINNLQDQFECDLIEKETEWKIDQKKFQTEEKKLHDGLLDLNKRQKELEIQKELVEQEKIKYKAEGELRQIREEISTLTLSKSKYEGQFNLIRDNTHTLENNQASLLSDIKSLRESKLILENELFILKERLQSELKSLSETRDRLQGEVKGHMSMKDALTTEIKILSKLGDNIRSENEALIHARDCVRVSQPLKDSVDSTGMRRRNTTSDTQKHREELEKMVAIEIQRIGGKKTGNKYIRK